MTMTFEPVEITSGPEHIANTFPGDARFVVRVGKEIFVSELVVYGTLGFAFLQHGRAVHQFAVVDELFSINKEG
jgi:hypothetical protein